SLLWVSERDLYRRDLVVPRVAVTVASAGIAAADRPPAKGVGRHIDEQPAVIEIRHERVGVRSAVCVDALDQPWRVRIGHVEDANPLEVRPLIGRRDGALPVSGGVCRWRVGGARASWGRWIAV